MRKVKLMYVQLYGGLVVNESRWKINLENIIRLKHLLSELTVKNI